MAEKKRKDRVLGCRENTSFTSVGRKKIVREHHIETKTGERESEII